jgi:TRAP-type C4-dicarboxylate transport system permease small subunit
MLTGIVRLLDRATAFAAGTVVVFIALTVLAGVVSRGVGEPFIWTDEVARFLMVWLACLGWILAGRHHSHIRIRFFLDKVPTRLRAAAEIAMQAAVVLFGALTAWFAVELVIRNLDIEATAVPISMSWMYAPVVLAGIVTAGQGLADLVAQVRRPGHIAASTSGGQAADA